MNARRAFAFAAIAQAIAACWGGVFDVGTSTRADAGADANAIVDASTDANAPADADAADARLSAFGNCLGIGARVYPSSAKELVDRLVGHWVQCPDVQISPLPCEPDAAVSGIRLGADGTFAVLGAKSEYGPFVEEPSPCRGTFKIWAPSPGGEAGAAKYVDFTDTQPRNGLEVHLFLDDGKQSVELPELYEDPQRMLLREQGALASGGFFAPIPASIR